MAALTNTRRLAQRWPRLMSLLWRLPGIAGLVVLLVVITFIIVHLVPGDPARNIVGLTATQDQVQLVRQQLGLDRSISSQFVSYVAGLVNGDLGTSFVTSQPVSELLTQRLPVTAELAGLGVVIVLFVGFPVGITIASLQRSGHARWASSSFTAGASVAGAMPEYIAGTLFILIFALSLHILPTQGGTSLQQIAMPAVTVAFAPTAIFARLVRNETTAVLGQEYIATAMAKRLPGWRLYLTHVLPNVVTSTLTLGSLILIALLGGTVITENVFNIPGLGTQIVQAILQNDYPAIQGIILVLGLLAILITVVVDVLLGVLDPRTLSRSKA